MSQASPESSPESSPDNPQESPSQQPAKKIKLDQFLKFKNLVGSGGEAKVLIQDGQVQVNEEIETRRGRKLVPGDVISLGGHTLTVHEDD